MTTPAGWYPDPQGRADQRFYNGRVWTNQVVANGTVQTDHPDADARASDERKSRASTRAMVGAICGIVGLVAFVFFSLAAATNCIATHGQQFADVGARLGILLMILGPLVAWFGIPAWTHWRHTRPRLGWAVLVACGLIAGGGIVLFVIDRAACP